LNLREHYILSCSGSKLPEHHHFQQVFRPVREVRGSRETRVLCDVGRRTLFKVAATTLNRHSGFGAHDLEAMRVGPCLKRSLFAATDLDPVLHRHLRRATSKRGRKAYGKFVNSTLSLKLRRRT
jgi:hypothetical protein